jgi:hypothetical protein
MQGKNLNEAVCNRETIARIKSLYIRGKINRETAEMLATPIINRINKKQQKIARNHGKRSYPKTTFIGLMR